MASASKIKMHLNLVAIVVLLFAPLTAAYSPRGSAELFTSRSCRACRAFEKKYVQLVADFPQVEFQKHELREDDKIGIFKNHKIRAVPSILFLRDGEEVTRFPAIKKNFQQIEVECARLSDPHFDLH